MSTEEFVVFHMRDSKLNRPGSLFCGVASIAPPLTEPIGFHSVYLMVAQILEEQPNSCCSSRKEVSRINRFIRLTSFCKDLQCLWLFPGGQPCSYGFPESMRFPTVCLTVAQKRPSTLARGGTALQRIPNHGSCIRPHAYLSFARICDGSAWSPSYML